MSHGLASGDATVASRMTELTGHVIRAWRRQCCDFIMSNLVRSGARSMRMTRIWRRSRMKLLTSSFQSWLWTLERDTAPASIAVLRGAGTARARVLRGAVFNSINARTLPLRHR